MMIDQTARQIMHERAYAYITAALPIHGICTADQWHARIILARTLVDAMDDTPDQSALEEAARMVATRQTF